LDARRKIADIRLSVACPREFVGVPILRAHPEDWRADRLRECRQLLLRLPDRADVSARWIRLNRARAVGPGVVDDDPDDHGDSDAARGAGPDPDPGRGGPPPRRPGLRCFPRRASPPRHGPQASPCHYGRGTRLSWAPWTWLAGSQARFGCAWQ